MLVWRHIGDYRNQQCRNCVELMFRDHLHCIVHLFESTRHRAPESKITRMRTALHVYLRWFFSPYIDKTNYFYKSIALFKERVQGIVVLLGNAYRRLYVATTNSSPLEGLSLATNAYLYNQQLSMPSRIDCGDEVLAPMLLYLPSEMQTATHLKFSSL